MSTIVTRSGKGSPLTHNEVDANFTNLNTDKYQSGDAATFTTLTANSTFQFGKDSANYGQGTGGATTKAVEFRALGSDTNVALALRSQGTGAIDLAAGSSGVNISNGGTVTAITRTAAGSGYTSAPSVAISAPNTAGGVQATASVTAMLAGNPTTVQSGGTGYTVNDTLTVVGGTPTGAAATYTVTAVSAGVVTAVTALNFASYSVLPTNPVTTTGGTGSGCTLNLTYGVASGQPTITNAGSGYVEQPTVTFSGGGGSGAAAYATVGAGAVIRALGATGAQSLDFQTASSINTSVPVLRLRDTAANSFLMLSNATDTAGIVAQGSANAVLSLASNGTQSIRFNTNGTTGAEQMRVAHTASAVNYVQVTGAATGGRPTISAQGSDTNATLLLAGKGTGAVDTAFYHRIGASYANWVQISGAVSGSNPSISSLGSDTNIDLALTPKGTGLVRFGTRTATADAPITGYIEIKDSGGTTRRIAVIG